MSLTVSKIDQHLELSLNQQTMLGELKTWVETEADFYGRSEEDFLVVYLRSCNFDLELSKKTLRLYYEARIKYPKWWANRDLNYHWIQFLIKQRVATALTDHADGNSPTIAIFHISRIGADSSVVDPCAMYGSCFIDVMARRKNCQLNGGILIVDYENCYWWMLRKALQPSLIKDVIHSFLFSTPIQMKMAVLVNAPAITSVVIKITKLFLPEAYKNNYCSRWCDIGKFISPDILPVEYGGNAGSIKEHEDAFMNEFLAMSEYFLEDNKYGFPTD